jgi:hypothetical protein
MGALVGQNIPTPALAFTVGAVSHFILDMIPHGDSHLYHGFKLGIGVKKSVAYVLVDAVCSIGVFIYLLEVAPYASRGTLIAGVIGGVIPDLLVALGEGWKIRPLVWFQRIHIEIHDVIVSRYGNIPLRWGIIMQIAVLAAMVLLVRR